MSTSRPSRRGAQTARRGYHHGDLRNALIAAALELIPETGARQLSLREVARRAGVSHGASYRHFHDKESLLAAVAEQGFNALALALRTAVTSGPQDPIAKLQAAGVAYVDFGVRHPHHLHVMLGGVIARADDHPALKLAARAAHNELKVVIAEILHGTNASALQTEVVAAAAWSIVHGLAVLLADGQLAGPDGNPLSREAQSTLATEVTGLFCRGLAVTPK